MSTFLLAGYDPAHRDPGPVNFAVATSKFTGASLVIAAVVGDVVIPETDYMGSPAMDPVGIEMAGVIYDETRKELGQAIEAMGVTAEPRVLTGSSAASALHHAAEELEAAMVVVGSTHKRHGGILRAGSTAERLLHGAPCPVAVVPQNWEAGGGLRTIGVGFANTPEGHEALKGGVALARRAGATLRLLAAVKTRSGGQPTGGHTGHERSTFDLAGEDEQAIEQAMRNLLGEDPGVEVDFDISAQDPGDFLVAASEQVDLLICGSRGHRPRRTALLGGTMRVVMRGAQCPVLVLAPGTEGQLEALADSPHTAAG